MIFVVLGTQKFQLNRLLIELDNLIEKGIVKDTIFAQIGESSYTPRHYQYVRFLEKELFEKKMEMCDILITHSGVGTIISGLKHKKPIIVYPRLAKFKEHVDDHQIEIAETFASLNYVLFCKENDDLKSILDECRMHKFDEYESQKQKMIDTINNYLLNVDSNMDEMIEKKEDKKIAIITLHRVRNYGSSLQTLATQKALQKNGCQAEVIDYYPERYTSFGLLKRLKYKNKHLEKNPILLLAARMIISVSYVKKKIVFDRFLRKYIYLTTKIYRRKEEFIEKLPQADAYCTGSDQVWNSYWNEGIDEPLYLSFVPETCYKFSYASSFGNSKLPEGEAVSVKPYLEQYKHITVRENTGVQILKDLGIEEAAQMLDPTLLFTGEEWAEYTSNKFADKKYVVTYNLHHDSRIDQYAARVARENGLKVYNISYNLHDIIRKGTLKWCPAVEEYLGLIRDAQYVVTDSFHATVFSILFKKKFVVIYPEKANSRIKSILELLQITDRGSANMPQIEQIMSEIDYERVDLILDKERYKAKQYLETIIQEICTESNAI